MALRTGLLSFEIKSFEGLEYDPNLDHEFGHSAPGPGESIQPVIEKVFRQIKKCVAQTISSQFNFGQLFLQNVNNFMHVASAVIEAEVSHADGTCGQTATMLTCKFYRLELPPNSYKISLELEEMPSSAASANELHSYGRVEAHEAGLENDKLILLAQLLDEHFQLDKQIECLPMLRRGRTDKPHFLTTSDERVVEHDFDRLLFHQQSEYQDVKVVSSPSLGNTLLLDNLQNLAENDLEIYTHTLMQKGKIDYFNKKILILGGGDGALLHELLKEQPKYVTMIEIDPVVIEACREHMRPFGESLCSLVGGNYMVHVGDCLEILQRCYDEDKQFDYIFNDLADIPVGKREECHIAFQPNLVQKDSLWAHIEAVFSLALDCLERNGRYMTHTTGRGNTEALVAFEKFLKKSRQPVKYETRQAYVPSFMETWVFYTIRKDFSRFTRPSHYALASRDSKQLNRYMGYGTTAANYRDDDDDDDDSNDEDGPE